MMRQHGLACDNVIAAEIVTADGQVRRASATENPDLFWAIRGGGGNFGVVTTFEFKLHPMKTLYAGMMVFPGPRASEVLRVYRDLAMAAPDELTLFTGLMTSPDGQPINAVFAAYNGPTRNAEARPHEEVSTALLIRCSYGGAPSRDRLRTRDGGGPACRRQ